MEILKIKGKAKQVFAIIRQMAELHGSMTLGELKARLNGGK